MVVQIAAATPDEAVAAARLVAHDCAGVDLNMGCPQPNATTGGMGAALLDADKHQTACDIIAALRKELPASVLVSAKIRLIGGLADPAARHEETRKLLRRLEAAGAQALAVHLRIRPERRSAPAHLDDVGALEGAVSVPLLVNGDVWHRQAGEAICAEYPGIAGAMLARGAQWNASVFGPADARWTLRQAAQELVRVGVEVDNPFRNTKYCVQQILRESKALNKDIGELVTRSKDWDMLCRAVGVSRKRKLDEAQA